MQTSAVPCGLCKIFNVILTNYMFLQKLSADFMDRDDFSSEQILSLKTPIFVIHAKSKIIQSIIKYYIIWAQE
jgi:hypothetical protein